MCWTAVCNVFDRSQLCGSRYGRLFVFQPAGTVTCKSAVAGRPYAVDGKQCCTSTDDFVMMVRRRLREALWRWGVVRAFAMHMSLRRGISRNRLIENIIPHS